MTSQRLHVHIPSHWGLHFNIGISGGHKMLSLEHSGIHAYHFKSQSYQTIISFPTTFRFFILICKDVDKFMYHKSRWLIEQYRYILFVDIFITLGDWHQEDNQAFINRDPLIVWKWLCDLVRQGRIALTQVTCMHSQSYLFQTISVVIVLWYDIICGFGLGNEEGGCS